MPSFTVLWPHCMTNAEKKRKLLFLNYGITSSWCFEDRKLVNILHMEAKCHTWIPKPEVPTVCMFLLLLHLYLLFSCSEIKWKYLEDVDPLLNRASKIFANDTEKAEVSSVFYASVFMGKISLQVSIWTRNDKANDKILSRRGKKKSEWIIVYWTECPTQCLLTSW